MNLELMAMHWLRWERRCIAVIRERSPRSWPCGRPDVLGVTQARYLIEIEVKRSVSDFRADQSKASRRNRDLYPKRLPKQFYYFAPREVAEKIQSELPAWAGLMGWDATWVQVPIILKKAPVNKLSERLTLKETCHFCHLMANHIVAVETTVESLTSGWRNGHEPYFGEDFVI
jgi:hypothetical protein